MMQYWIERAGSFDGIQMRDVPFPEPGPYEVVIRVHASSLNYRDLPIVLGSPIAPSAAVGRVPLSDGAGQIVAVGELVRGFAIGDRVAPIFRQNWLGGDMPPRAMQADLGGSRSGVLTEAMAINEEGLVHIPDSLSYVEAATLPCAAVTAWHALHVGAPLLAGDTVLIQGSGGVALFALQLAKARGARVLAISSSDEKAERLRALGADLVVNYTSVPDWDGPIRAATEGRGVDRVVEIGGAGTLQRSIRATALGGRIALVGILAGRAAMDPSDIFFRRLNIHGISTGSRQMFIDMLKTMTAYQIRPVIDRVFEFERAIEAYRYFDRGVHFGKIAIDHKH